jgi:hypothetical protein
MGETEPTGAEHFIKIGTSGLGPSGFVVSACDEIRDVQTLELLLAQLHTITVTGFGDIAGNEHKINAIHRFDIVY